MGRTSDEFRRIIAKRAEEQERERYFHETLRQKKLDHEQRIEDEASFLSDVITVMATEAELEALRVTLSRYRVATTEALLENEIALAEAEGAPSRYHGACLRATRWAQSLQDEGRSASLR